MLYGRKDKEEADYLDPIFGSTAEFNPLPKYELNP